MMDVVGVCYRLIGHLVQAIRAPRSSSAQLNPEPTTEPHIALQLDDLAARALTTVFGMDAEGRIPKEKARRVVEKLGLIGGNEDGSSFDLLGSSEDVLLAEDLVGGSEEDGERRAEMLRQAFTVFDEDGDGFIEAIELKRVLQCLGLANGWNIKEFEKMVQVVDLNFDGKVDFSEFELMMGENI